MEAAPASMSVVPADTHRAELHGRNENNCKYFDKRCGRRCEFRGSGVVGMARLGFVVSSDGASAEAMTSTSRWLRTRTGPSGQTHWSQPGGE
jgi:hypothetical protein